MYFLLLSFRINKEIYKLRLQAYQLQGTLRLGQVTKERTYNSSTFRPHSILPGATLPWVPKSPLGDRLLNLVM